MQNYMHRIIAYLMAFTLSWWPAIETRIRQLDETIKIAFDVASTDSHPLEKLRLMNIAAMESNFNTHAVGRHGELGAFQIMPPAESYGAKEALRRMRLQGMQGYCGCTSPCPELVAHRTEKADVYYWAIAPPEWTDEDRLAEEAKN